MRFGRSQIGQMMLVLVGRRQLGLGYVLPRMCDEALRGFGERPGVLA